MEIEAGANKEIVDRLQANFRLEPWQVFHVAGPTNLSRLIPYVRPDAASGLEVQALRFKRTCVETRRILDF